MRNWILSVLTVCFLCTGQAAAQDTTTDEFSTLRFTPAVGAGNYAMVDGALVTGRGALSGLVLLDYAHRPFVIFEADCSGEDCSLDGKSYDIVAYQLTANVGGAITFADRFQVGLLVPIVASSGDGYHASRGTPDSRPVRILGGSALSLGDPRLSAKVGILGNGSEGLHLAAVVYGTVPIARELAPGRGMGFDGFTAGGHAVGEFRTERFRAALNLGGVWQPKTEILSTKGGPEFTYGAAANVALTTLFSVTGELTGTSRFSTKLDQNTLELRALGNLGVGEMTLHFGAGAGLIGGVGTPNFRVLAGASYAPQKLDSDGDGVQDKDDHCPGAIEDMDGYLDEDGCPEVDNDADGLPDEADKCPDEAEDIDNFEDGDGCPDVDNDNDGIRDGYDSCPDEPEDMDGDRDDDGCPDDDRDRDGVPDDVDKCPNEPEDTDGFGDEDGCPEEDFDADGIPDDLDECPDEAEDLDGLEDNDGCPEEGENFEALEQQGAAEPAEP